MLYLTIIKKLKHMRRNFNIKLIEGTNITVKEFHKLQFEVFKTWPLQRIDYKKNRLEMHQAFYPGKSVTFNKIKTFCKKLNVKFEEGYTGWAFSKGIFVNLK
jgi:hypothetical protein